MTCPKCHNENPEVAKFCGECGTKLEIKCQSCGKGNPPGNKFCHECGDKISEAILKDIKPPQLNEPQAYIPQNLKDKILETRSSIEGERKLVTVLFADVKGSTSIGEHLDPEELRTIIEKSYEISMKEIHRFEGTVNQFLGDGFMALFGAPIAHEDHAVRATHSALAIQNAMDSYSEDLKNNSDIEFKMRIGINSGTVVVGNIGDDLKMDYTALGDTVNLASRMEQIAKPGNVMVSESTYKIAKDYFNFKPLGAVDIKGKKKPVSVYDVISPKEEEKTRLEISKERGFTKFIGREGEIEVLRDSFVKSKEGLGQVVTIIGDAGIGKSRLLYEFSKLIENENVLYVEGRCISYGKSISYLPVIEIIKKRFRIDKLDTERTIKKKIEKGIGDIDPNLKGVIPFIYDILSIDADDSILKSLDVRDKRKRTLETIKNILLADSALRPLVVVVENLHWIDSASEEFITFLIDNIPNSKILLILTSRPGYKAKWSEKSYHIQIAPSRLSDTEVEEMTKSILENEKVTGKLFKLIIDKADGIPFYVEEIIKSFTEGGIIVRGEYGYSVSKGIAEVDVPDTIQDIIMARIDRLEENLKGTLQYASIIGREFSYKLLKELMEIGEELQDYLTQLKGIELVYEKSIFPDLEYRFKHSLTQEVAYNSLLIKKRKEFHGIVGEIIEDLYGDKLEENYELLAYHYGRSTRDEKAVEYLILAGDKSARIYSTEDAIGNYEEALKRQDKMPDTKTNKEKRVDLFIKQARVMRLMGRFKEHIKTLEENLPIVEELGDKDRLAEYYFKMEFYYSVMGEIEESNKYCTKSVELAEVTKNDRIIGLASVRQGYNYWYKGEFKKAISIIKNSIKILERLGDHYWVARSFQTIGACYWQMGDWDNSMNYLQKLLKKSEEISDNNLMILALWSASMPHIDKGEWDIAINYCERCLEMSPPPVFAVFATGFLGIAYYKGGQLKKGIDCMEKAIHQTKQFGLKQQEVITTVHLGEAYLSISERERALENIKSALEVSKQSGFRHLEGIAYRVLGEIYGGTDFNKGKKTIEESIRILKKVGAKNELAKSYLGLGKLFKEKGENNKAKKYVTQSLHIFEKLGTLHEPEKARKLLNELK
ncbi:tetratricopeptide repeat protein [Desulfobacterota bacterium AH_259_B03_O07]|nr:tetratricopeptide repeat protein [Desulfobacterota bacterium AH_259_B03_O07]